MSLPFSGRVALVTGAAGALGRAVAGRLAEAGARVAHVDLDDELLHAAFPTRAPRHAWIAADLTRRDGARAAVAAAEQALGRIDVVCNIAGGFRMGPAVHDTPDSDWDFLFDLNARTVLNMAAAAVPALRRAGGGAIINVGARAALAGTAGMGAYVASKATVIRLTETMAQELKAEGIRVNCVMPGIIDTPANRAAMPDADPGAWAAPADIARVIAFLASDEARIVHGACVPVAHLS